MSNAEVPLVVAASGDASAAPDGSVPIALYGIPSSGGGATAWTDITGKPAVIAAGADAAAARTAIGAGTSNLVVGTGAAQAKAGNYVPAWGDVTGKPATFPPETHNQGANTISVVTGATLTGATVQLALEALAARVAALETP